VNADEYKQGNTELVNSLVWLGAEE